MLAEFLILLLLLIVNGLFAMAELAVFSARRTRLMQLADRGSRGARAALRLLGEPTRFLSTVQIGITLIGVLAGVYSGARFAAPLGEWLGQRIGSLEQAETLAYALVVIGVTYLTLVIGELVPKRWALGNPEGIAALLAPPMELIARASAPLVWLLQRSTELILRLLGRHRSADNAVTEEDVRAMIAEGTRAGVFHVAEHQMIEGVLRLPDRTVRSIMVPRGEVAWIDDADSRDSVWSLVHSTGHSRYLVCRGELDELVGVIHTSELMDWLRNPDSGPLGPRARAPLVVHESTRILRMLEIFRESKLHLAVLVDEHGSIEGIATPTDILTAIAGEIPDLGGTDVPEAVDRGDQSWLIDGRMGIDDVQRLLQRSDMRAGDDYTTLAGFVLAQLGHLPATGEKFRWRSLQFEVVDMDGRRVDKLLVTRLAPEPVADELAG